MLHKKDHTRKLLKGRGVNKLFTIELIVVIIMMILCILVLVYGVMEYFLSYWKDSPQWGSMSAGPPP